MRALAAAAVWASLPTTTARAASEPPATTSPAVESSSRPSAGQAPPPRARIAPHPRSHRYVQVVANDASILAAPGGTVVARVRRGTVFELTGASRAGYEVLLHSGQIRLLPQKSAQPVLYRPLEVDNPALRQQVLSAIVEAQSRANREAAERAHGARPVLRWRASSPIATPSTWRSAIA